ncbi:HSP20-like chaperone [Protomyces lactucae-debilis]|uniref:HSP20-like chaperone n=1 Tax=Protomyces lactucae-debilis TaxID=2754530 RepID=A0A1Y2FP55_PROLT|nr:HSP20-like chaperone [Protomyces lactucae-debilis]ORY85753.1 HSP20-like chaperone [Protomyces lactucae-debilis]
MRLTLTRRSNESEHDKNVLYVTVVCPDIEDPKISIESKSLKVHGKDKHGKEYALDLEFFAEVEAEATKQRHTGLNLFFIFQKKEDKAEFWPRLTSSKAKQHNIRTDFDKWVDEDEQDEALEMRKISTIASAD